MAHPDHRSVSVQGPSRALLDVLARSVLFRSWPAEALVAVGMRLSPVGVRAGTVACAEGRPGDAMFVVEDGRFAVEATLGDRQLRLAELGPGAVFGEMAVLTGRPRSATVTALTEARLWMLGRDDFQALVRLYPQLRATVEGIVSERAADTTRSRLAYERQLLQPLDGQAEAATIGRDPANSIVLDDPRVSRFHAAIRRVGEGYEIIDLDSRNGTFVNRERVRARRLADGDELWISSHVIHFDSSALSRFSRGGGTKVDASGLTRVVGRGTIILSDVSLSIYPGELVGIVGGSGAGKTTLLDALSGCRPPTSGTVLYNGVDYYAHLDLFRHALGYVPQDDIVHPELTVHQTLYFAARLRLPEDTSGEEIERRIGEVLADLELGERRDVQVRRLSGGQRKRVSIAVELLTRPQVFFLDEPTSGLDPGLDRRMMELLRKLADQGRTVILTTHATRNIMVCDKVVFMATGGRLTFFGSPAEALAHFGVEDFADIYRLLEEESAARAWQGRFQQSELYRRNVEQRLEPGGQLATPGGPAGGPAPRPAREPTTAGTSSVHQLAWLTARFLAILRADWISLGALLTLPPVSGLLLAANFPSAVFAVDWRDGGEAPHAVALLFLLVTTSLLLGGFVASRSIAEEVAIYARERLINLGIIPYVLSKVCTLGLFSLVQSALLLGAVAARIELPGDTRTLAQMYSAVVLINLGAVGLGLVISSITNNGLQATLLLLAAMIPQISMAGATVPLSRVPELPRAASDLMMTRWAVSLLGHYADMNTRIDAQLPRNNYTDQFNIDPTLGSLILAGMFVGQVVVSMLILKRKDVR